MSIDYFAGVDWEVYSHLPHYVAWLEFHFDSYALNYAHTGRIQWAMDDRELITLNAPVTWWTFPGPRFAYGSVANESWDHSFITFDGPRVRRWIQHGLLPMNTPTPYAFIRQPLTIRQTFDTLFACLAQGTQAYPQTVHLFEGLLLQIVAQPAINNQYISLDERIRDLMEQIRIHPERHWDMGVEAEQLNVSYAHFRRLFCSIANVPPNQFVIKSRLDRASHLLRTTGLPITAVAEAVGYDDYGYFSRCFKHHWNMSPTMFRKHVQLCQDDSSQV